MSTLTLKVPDTLARQLREKQISEREIQAIVVATLEVWLANLESSIPTSTPGRFGESGALFARRLIQQNRELFQLLAQR